VADAEHTGGDEGASILFEDSEVLGTLVAERARGWRARARLQLDLVFDPTIRRAFGWQLVGEHVGVLVEEAGHSRVLFVAECEHFVQLPVGRTMRANTSSTSPLRQARRNPLSEREAR